MQGLMMEYPLTLTQFFERSRRLFAQKTLATRVPGRPLFRYTYADFAERVARLAGGLAALGVRQGDRVGTFAWNTHHLEAYWAVPMMGAVLHTVNFRLAPEDIVYIINHAEDSVFLVGASVWPLLEPIRQALTIVRQFVIIRDVPEAALPPGVIEYLDTAGVRASRQGGGRAVRKDGRESEGRCKRVAGEEEGRLTIAMPIHVWSKNRPLRMAFSRGARR